MKFKNYLLNEFKLQKYIPSSGDTVYHVSPHKFDKFKRTPTWFFPEAEEAEALMKEFVFNRDKNSYGYKCSLKTDNFINEHTQTNLLISYVQKVWPDEDQFLYSMTDPVVGEYKTKNIKEFITLLINDGYNGIVMTDYSQINNQKDAISLIVFNPTKYISIDMRINYEDINKLTNKYREWAKR